MLISGIKKRLWIQGKLFSLFKLRKSSYYTRRGRYGLLPAIQWLF